MQIEGTLCNLTTHSKEKTDIFNEFIIGISTISKESEFLFDFKNPF